MKSQAEHFLDVEWNQDLSCVELTVPMPEDASSKDVKCEFASMSLKFSIPGKMEPINGTLLHRCLPDESYWQVWPVGATGRDRKIKILIAKAEEKSWKRLFTESSIKDDDDDAHAEKKNR